jgi:octaprenyl-diphosphate synthase
MSATQKIKAPILRELESFEGKFKESMRSSVPLLDKITHYIIKRKGKQLRPVFVLLSAKMIKEVTDASFTAASLIELLHTATLVHDDVVDDAAYRRGFLSINALWKNKIAVLVGDYLLSKGLLLSMDNNQFEMLRIVTEAVRQMSEGELLQMEKARKLDITEEVYFEIIRAKTASLIAACCEAGGASAGASLEDQKKLKDFGMLTGTAFQIKDDIFDYGDGDPGKPTGIDIKERKMTLPLIYALSKAEPGDRKRIIRLVRHRNEDPEAVKEVVNWVKDKGGVDFARNKMVEIKNQALEILTTFPRSEARESLETLLDYTVNRTK